jgi:hypothetical protein
MHALAPVHVVDVRPVAQQTCPEAHVFVPHFGPPPLPPLLLPLLLELPPKPLLLPLLP